MAVCHGRAHVVLGATHVLSLVVREHLDDHKLALSLLRVDRQLEVRTALDWLTVEEPRDVRRRRASEQHTEHDLVPVAHRLVRQRHHELWRFLQRWGGVVHLLLTQERSLLAEPA